MFYLQDTVSRLYFHYEGKIILFNTSEEANFYMDLFTKYSIQRLLQESQNPAALIEVHQRLSTVQLFEWDFEQPSPPCGFVNFNEIFTRK